MAATITWAVTAMDEYPEQDGEQDVVFNVHWTCAGTQVEGETTYTASVYSTQAVTTNPDEPFTPYAQLTEAQVLGWIWAAGVDQATTEAAVQQQIDNQINPPVVSLPLPWATPA